MCEYVAAVTEEIMELLQEKVFEQLDVLVPYRKLEHKRKHSSDESDGSDEEAKTVKRTRSSASTSTTEESSSYDEMDDSTEKDPLNIVITAVYQTTACQTDPTVKEDASTQTDDVMI